MFKILALVALVVTLRYLYGLYQSRPKKVFSEKTNILITGGAQGIGKLLAQKFAAMHGTKVNLIVLDIADHLAP
jgi:NADPH:quinone reductase-like Zn-dependent oxidoreductase